MTRKSEVRDVAERTPELAPADNHAAVCVVLKWAVRTPGVSRVEIQDLCEELGLDMAAARIHGQTQRQAQWTAIRDRAIGVVAEALREVCDDLGDVGTRKVAAIAVDDLLAHRDLLAQMAALP
ncbi:MAG: hypothetical protein ACRDRL_26220 [Sciscionella sp.]